MTINIKTNCLIVFFFVFFGLYDDPVHPKNRTVESEHSISRAGSHGTWATEAPEDHLPLGVFKLFHN